MNQPFDELAFRRRVQGFVTAVAAQGKLHNVNPYDALIAFGMLAASMVEKAASEGHDEADMMQKVIARFMQGLGGVEVTVENLDEDAKVAGDDALH